MFVTKSPCKISEPVDYPFWEKSNQIRGGDKTLLIVATKAFPAQGQCMHSAQTTISFIGSFKYNGTLCGGCPAYYPVVLL